jgi:adenylate kinase family enzyme
VSLAIEERLHRAATASLVCRVLVCGNGGSGKTRLASTLAELYGLNFISIDAIRWDDDWKQRSPEDVLVKLQAAVASPRWVVEDGALRWLSLLVPRSDLILWLDTGQSRCAFRVARRALRRRLGMEARERANAEPFGHVLRHCRWCLRYNAERRPAYEEIQRTNPDRALRLANLSAQELYRHLARRRRQDLSQL